MTNARSLGCIALLIIITSPVSYAKDVEELRAAYTETIVGQVQTTFDQFQRSLSQGHLRKRSCWLFDEQRTCMVFDNDDVSLIDNAIALPQGFTTPKDEQALVYTTPYRAFSPFNVLGWSKQWPAEPKDKYPICQSPETSPSFALSRPHASVAHVTLLPVSLSTVAAEEPQRHGNQAATRPLSQDLEIHQDSFDKFFRERQLIVSKFYGDDSGYRGELLVPIDNVEEGETALAFWEYWANRAQGCAELDCPLVFRDSPISISYCNAEQSRGELGPAHHCKRVVVYMPDGPWIRAFTAPWEGYGCGFGEDDFTCSYTGKGFATKVANALEQPPLMLSVNRTRSGDRIVGTAKMRRSQVLENYFEHVAVELYISGKQLDKGDDESYGFVDVAVTVLVSRQNSGSRSDYRAASDAQQAEYVRTIEDLFEAAGCI